MGRYKISGKNKSSAVLPANISNLKIDMKSEKYTIEAELYNAKSEFEDVSIANELVIKGVIELFLEEDSIHSAIGYFTYEMNKVLEKMAYTEAVPITEFQPIKCYSVSEGENERTIIKYGYNLLDAFATTSINPVNLNQLIIEVQKLDDKVKRRIERAIHWYSKAISEEKCLDRFTYMWIAFEALEPLFARKFKIDEINKCKQCGYEKVLEGKGSMKYFFGNHLKKEHLYSKSRSIRNALQHSFKDVIELTREVLLIEDELLECLREAILYFINVKKNIINHPNLGNSEEIRVEVILKTGDYLKKAGEEFEPNIDILLDIDQHKNEYVIVPNIKVNFMNYGVELCGMSWTIYGNPGRHIKKQQIKISS